MNACIHCHYEMGDLATYCANCGALLPMPSHPVDPVELAEKENDLLAYGGKCSPDHHAIVRAIGGYCEECGKACGRQQHAAVRGPVFCPECGKKLK